MKTKLLILSLCIFSLGTFLVFPTVTEAQSAPYVATDMGFVPCEGTMCSACHFIELGNRIIDWLIGVLALLFAVIMIVSGFRLVTSGGNQSAKEGAKSSLTNALIGFLIVLAAWLVVDTVMRALLGGSGQINGATPWSQIECWKQREAGIVEYKADDQNFYTTGVGVAGGAGGGQCTELSSGPCSTQNLQKYFGGRAAEASRICNKESGGAPIESQTDKCADGKSFSGGYFQINIISEADKIPGCVKSELVVNPNLSDGGIGGCAVARVTSSNGIRYCPRRQCEFKSNAMYNKCMSAAREYGVNLAVAKRLFDARGFQPWVNSRNACGISN